MRDLIQMVEQDILPDDFDDEDDNYQNVVALEKSIRSFCATELGWEFDGVSYPVSYNEDDREVVIRVVDTDVTLEDLQKIAQLGDGVRVTTTTLYHLDITFIAHEGLNLSGGAQ